MTMVRFKDNVTKRMVKQDVVWTEHGVRVGYSPVEAEKYIDQTQNFMVKAWNLGTAKSSEEKRVRGLKYRKDR